ncbi:MAG: hypothetical protein SFV15_18920 [Polyangiaceae bacterium]|nr:hypothetical protein [Polyangiaceae bacterium]
MITQSELDQLSREEIIAKARVLGVTKPELLTRVELADEIIRITAPTDHSRKDLRGWLGVARDLVANVVEAGLHLPDAAAVIRGEAWSDTKAVTRKPVATVTLAEIYATQRHYNRALSMLDEVLRQEPDHEAARELRQDILKKTTRAAVLEDEAISEQASPVSEQAPPASEASPVDAADSEANKPAEPPPESVPVESVPTPLQITTDAAFFSIGAGNVRLYWEISESTLLRMKERAPEGRLVARIIGLTPALGRPLRSSQDIALSSGLGCSVAAGFEPNTVVRVACGWLSGALFKPLVVAIELDGGALTAGQIVRRFTPPAIDLPTLALGERRALEMLRAG